MTDGGARGGGAGTQGNAPPSAAGRAVPVVAGGHDAFEDVLARVRAAGRGGVPVDLVVARESGLLLTAGEFRALREAIDRDRLRVTLRCDDSLRDGLARAMGVERRRIPPELRGLLQPSAPAPVAAPSARPDPAGGSPAPDPHQAFRRPAEQEGDRRSGPTTGAGNTPAGARAAGNGDEGATAVVAVASTTNRPAADDADGGGAASPTGSGTAPGQVNPDAAGVAAAVASEPATPGTWPEQPGVPPPSTTPLPEPRPRSRPGGRFRRRRADDAAGVEAVPGWAETGGTASDATAPAAVGHRGGFAAAGPPAPAVVAQPVPVPPADGPTGPTFDEIVAPRYRGGGRPRWVGAVLALAALAVLAALAAALLVPRATVAVTLRTAPVAGEALVDVTASGQPLDGAATLALAATPVEVEVRFSGSVPTTGARSEPDATATGAVRFANPAPEAVTVPAGTELTTGGGIVFLTEADVAVPGADPATGQSGQAEGTLRAAQPGTGGNVAVGEIGGRLPSGVYYSNRDAATAGGTDRQVPVVAAADLEALRVQADAALAEQATVVAQEQLGEGAQLAPGSATAIAGDEVFSAQEGEAADAVSLEAARTVRALAWSPDAVQGELRGILAGPPAPFLGGQAPEGWIVDPASVRFGDPVVDGGSPDGARVRIPVEAATTPRFGPDERRALAERLAGLDEAAATAALATEPALAGSRIAFRPGWFLHRLPNDPERIDVEVE